MAITLRKTGLEDINFLNEIRGKELPKLHDYRLDEQEKGKSLYLIAFQDEKPVGHVYIKLKGSEEYHNSSALQDLYVSTKFRRKGIGGKIIQEAEQCLKSLGYKEVSLDVETNEEWIRKFYEKQGFMLKSGPHKQSWIEKDTNEVVKVDVFHLEKEIE
jgi:ribosomal protein S18 acetylase RimI-like enzyme